MVRTTIPVWTAVSAADTHLDGSTDGREPEEQGHGHKQYTHVHTSSLLVLFFSRWIFFTRRIISLAYVVLKGNTYTVKELQHHHVRECGSILTYVIALLNYVGPFKVSKSLCTPSHSPLTLLTSFFSFQLQVETLSSLLLSLEKASATEPAHT